MYSKGNLVYTLSKLKAFEYIERLKKWLDSQKDEYVLEDGINAVGVLSGREDIPYLFKFTKSEDPVVRAKAYIGIYTAGYRFTDEDIKKIKEDNFSIVNSIYAKYIQSEKCNMSDLSLEVLMHFDLQNNVLPNIQQTYQNVNTVVNKLN